MQNWLNREIARVTVQETAPPTPPAPIEATLEKNIIYMKEKLGASFDILYKQTSIGKNKAILIMDDGMCDNLLVTQQVVNPIMTAEDMPQDASAQMAYIRDQISAGIDQKEIYNLDDAITEVLSGVVVLLIDGATVGEAFGVQGFPKRSVEDAQTEVQERGAREAFVESFKDNVALMRRRVRSPVARFEIQEVGVTSKTRVCVCYFADRADKNTVHEVKDRLQKAELDVVLGAGYLRPFLESDVTSMFSSVGSTERPDVACAEMAEGRVVILVDGTPFALVVPYLFLENFQSLDDYNHRPYYSGFIRLLKFLAFVVSIFLPGLYVAVCTFHQEILPTALLYDTAIQESITPFPVMLEAIFIHFIYEIVREAGLRMPKSVGHAVSIVGALVIGDAAVSAGLIAAPMLIVVAMTAISSFVVSKIYYPVSILRFIFMVIGGLTGFYGIVLGFGVLLTNMCAVKSFGTPFTAPVAPLHLGAIIRDFWVRLSWKKLGKRELKIQNLEK